MPKCDTAPGNKLIQAKGLAHDLPQSDRDRLEQRRDDEQPVVTSSPVGALTTDAALEGCLRGQARAQILDS
jgi:hypothetical protein